MDEKKKRKNKIVPQLPSEQTPVEKLAHEELARQDKDPTYPFEPVKQFWKGSDQNRKDKK